jgi:ribosomal protein L21E
MIEVGDMVRIKRGAASHTPYLGRVGQIIELKPEAYVWTVYFERSGALDEATMCYHADEIEPARERGG